MKVIFEFYSNLPWLQRQVIDLMLKLLICILIVLTGRLLIAMVDYIGLTPFLIATCTGFVWFIIDLVRLYSADKKRLSELANATAPPSPSTGQPMAPGVGSDRPVAGGRREGLPARTRTRA